MSNSICSLCRCTIWLKNTTRSRSTTPSWPYSRLRNVCSRSASDLVTLRAELISSFKHDQRALVARGRIGRDAHAFEQVGGAFVADRARIAHRADDHHRTGIADGQVKEERGLFERVGAAGDDDAGQLLVGGKQLVDALRQAQPLRERQLAAGHVGELLVRQPRDSARRRASTSPALRPSAGRRPCSKSFRRSPRSGRAATAPGERWAASGAAEGAAKTASRHSSAAASPQRGRTRVEFIRR